MRREKGRSGRIKREKEREREKRGGKEIEGQ